MWSKLPAYKRLLDLIRFDGVLLIMIKSFTTTKRKMFSVCVKSPLFVLLKRAVFLHFFLTYIFAF